MNSTSAPPSRLQDGVVDQLTILAPGLLGGSVAQAAHTRGVAKKTVIWARRPEIRDTLRQQPWCSEVASTAAEAVRNANLIVIAAPVERIIDLAREIAAALPPGCLVTDVGSVKGELCRACHQAMPAHATFIGSHPMAGSQKTGWENGSPSLFEGRTCFVTPLPGTRTDAVESVSIFWASLGGKVATVSPDVHDEIVAHISHLPQAIATSLCAFLARKDGAWRAFAGGGLRDTTRIAGSDATMWIEIFQQNRDEVLRALTGFQDELQALQSAIANREWEEVREQLVRGKLYRDGFPL